MNFIRETNKREITEVYLNTPMTLSVGGELVNYSRNLRIAKIRKFVEGGKLNYNEITGYEFETCLNGVCKWHKMDKATYDKIVKITKAWFPDYRGSFEISKKIIGISF